MTRGRRPRTISTGVLVTMLLTAAALGASGILFYASSVAQVTAAAENHDIAVILMMDKEQEDKEAAGRREEILDAWKLENAAKNELRQERDAYEKAARALGYTVVSDGYYFMQNDEGDCSSETGCATFNLMIGNACPSGVALTIEMLEDDVTQGAVYATTEGLPAGGVALLNVNMTLGTHYRVSEAECMG